MGVAGWKIALVCFSVLLMLGTLAAVYLSVTGTQSLNAPSQTQPQGVAFEHANPASTTTGFVTVNVLPAGG